ncbi:MAG: radical SAM protein [Myxococcales bacterium]|nr:radical SAM protein [Myxococcales bacterium]
MKKPPAAAPSGRGGKTPRGGRTIAAAEIAPVEVPPPLAVTLPAPASPVNWKPEHGRPYPFFLEFVVTEQCNLRCVYCMNLDGIAPPAPEQEVRYDEMLAIARACAERGVNHVWVTGGEPLGRKGIFQFLTDLAKINGVRDVHLTTNGILLKEALPSLDRSGVNFLDVHLDTLRSLEYHKVTKQDWLYRVQEGLAAAEDAGFTRIGLHVTVVRGFNEDELVDFAMLTKMGPYQVRFAEVLPRTISEPVDRLQYLVPREEIFSRIDSFERLHRVDVDDGVPGTEYYRFHDGIGEIAILGPSGDCVTAAGPRLRVGPTGEILDSVGGFVGNLKEILAEGGPLKLGERLEQIAGLRRPEAPAKA